MRPIATALLLFIGACTSACTDEGSSTRALRAQGFTNIEFTGYSMFSCGDDDTFKTGFTATNPQGQQVSGTVCCGLLVKDCTVRW